MHFSRSASLALFALTLAVSAAHAQLAAVKTVEDASGDGVFIPGEVVQYVIGLETAVDLTGVRVTDTLPAALIPLRVIALGGADLSRLDENAVEIDELVVPALGGNRIVIEARVKDRETLIREGFVDPVQVGNVAQVEVDGARALTNEAAFSVRLGRPELTLAKGVQALTTYPGTRLTFELVAENQGAVASPVSLQDSPAEGLRPLPETVTLNGQALSAAAGASLFAEGLLINALGGPSGVLGTRERAVVTYQVEALAVGWQRNQAVLRAGSDRVVAEAVIEVLERPTPRLSLAKRVDRASVVVGERVNWTLALTNEGDAPGQVTVLDELPPSLAYVQGSARLDDGQAVVVADGLLLSSFTVAPGATRRLTFATAVTAAGRHTNVGRFVSDDGQSGESAPVAVTAQGAPALTLTQTPAALTLPASAPATFALTVANEGASALSALTVTQVFPEGAVRGRLLGLPAGSTARAIPSAAGLTLEAALPVLAPGAQWTFQSEVDTASEPATLCPTAQARGLAPSGQITAAAEVRCVTTLASRALSGVVYEEQDLRPGFTAGDEVFSGFRVSATDALTGELKTALTDSRGRYQLTGSFNALTVDSGEAGVQLAPSLPAGDALDLPLQATGRVFDSVSGELLDGAQLFLYEDQDSANDDPTDAASRARWRLVPAADLEDPRQQGQRTAHGGLYRFAVRRAGRFILEVVPPSPAYLSPSLRHPPLTVYLRDAAPVVPSARPTADAASPYGLGFAVEAGKTPLHNHIPLDPAGALVTVTKRALRPELRVGEIATFELTVHNQSQESFSPTSPQGAVYLEDLLPPALSLVEGSARLVGAPLPLEVRREGARLLLGALSLPAGGRLTLRYQAALGVSAKANQRYTNRARLVTTQGIALSAVAEATLQVLPDPVFDQGLLLGDVYCDEDQDGAPGPAEPSLPGVRVYLDDGRSAETDRAGRFHFPSIAPGRHAVKLDPATLLPGAIFTTEGLRVISLTPGLPAKVAFGVTCPAEPVSGPSVFLPDGSPLTREGAPLAITGNVQALTARVGDTALRAPPLGLTLLADDWPAEGRDLLAAGRLPALVFVLKAPSDTQRYWVRVGPPGTRGAVALEGLGASPPRLPWDGAGLLPGGAYEHRLEIELKGGARVGTSPGRFGVGASATPTELVAAFEGAGLRDGAPEPALAEGLARLGPTLAALKGALLVELHAEGGRAPERAAKETARDAAALAAYLAKAHPHLKVEPIAMGTARPRYPNLTRRHRALNRRVELRRLAVDAPPAPGEVRVGRARHPVDAAGDFALTTPIPPDGVVELTLVGADGRFATFQAQVASGSEPALASPREVTVALRPPEALTVGGEPVSLAGLAVALSLTERPRGGRRPAMLCGEGCRDGSRDTTGKAAPSYGSQPRPNKGGDTTAKAAPPCGEGCRDGSQTRPNKAASPCGEGCRDGSQTNKGGDTTGKAAPPCGEGCRDGSQTRPNKAASPCGEGCRDGSQTNKGGDTTDKAAPPCGEGCRDGSQTNKGGDTTGKAAPSYGSQPRPNKGGDTTAKAAPPCGEGCRDGSQTRPNKAASPCGEGCRDGSQTNKGGDTTDKAAPPCGEGCRDGSQTNKGGDTTGKAAPSYGSQPRPNRGGDTTAKAAPAVEATMAVKGLKRARRYALTLLDESGAVVARQDAQGDVPDTLKVSAPPSTVAARLLVVTREGALVESPLCPLWPSARPKGGRASLAVDGVLAVAEGERLFRKVSLRGAQAVLVTVERPDGGRVTRLVVAPEASAPLGSAPLGSAPLGSAPLGSAPLGSAPLGSAPLGSAPLGSAPLGSAPLGSAPLGSAPLGSAPLGSAPLGSTPLGSAPLGSAPLGSAPLGSAPLGSAPLGSAPLGSAPLGSAPLGSAPLGSAPLGSAPLGSAPLGSAPLGSAPLGSTPLGSAPLGSAPLGSAPLGSAPLGSAPLGSAPLGSAPLGSVPLGSAPLGSAPFGSTPLAPRGSAPLGSPSSGSASPTSPPPAPTAGELEVLLPAEGAALLGRTLPVRGRTHPDNRLWLNGAEVAVDADGRFAAAAAFPAGQGELEIRTEDRAGHRGRLTRTFKVPDHAWFLLAVGEGRLGTSAADALSAPAGIGDLDAQGRGAVFLKGYADGRDTLGGVFKDYRLTTHLDTARSADEPRRLLLSEPLGGDEALLTDEASRRGPLFLQLEADSSRLTVGDFRSDLRGVALFQYDRALSGAHLSLALPSEAPAHRLSAFVTDAQDEVAHAVVELRGTGGSLYYLPHRALVEGSVQVELVERDAQTGLELSRRRLVLGEDYTQSAEDGRLTLVRPLSSVGAQRGVRPQRAAGVLDGNPRSLIVTYDHRDLDRIGGQALGAQLRETFGPVTLGASVVQEGRGPGLADYELKGAELRFAPAPRTVLEAELAHSERLAGASLVSDDGGLTFTPRTPAAGERASGDALLLRGALELADWVGEGPDWWRTELYYQREDAGFMAGARQSALLSAESPETLRWGARTLYSLAPGQHLDLRHDQSEQQTSDRRARQALSRASYTYLREGLRLAAEFAHTDTTQDGQAALTTDALAASADLPLTARLTLLLAQEAVLKGDSRLHDSVADLLTTTAGARYQLGETWALTAQESVRWSGDNATQLGTRLTVDERHTTYLEQRFAQQAGQQTATSVVGAEERLDDGGRAFGEYQLDAGDVAGEQRAVLGVRHRKPLVEGLVLEAGYERAQVFGARTLTQDAVSLGVEWQSRGGVALRGRYELRVDDHDERQGERDKLQFVALDRLELKLSRAFKLNLRADFSRTFDQGLGALQAELIEGGASLAYRPEGTRRVAFLLSYSKRLEQRPVDLLLERPTREVWDVVSVTPVVELGLGFQWVEKGALKRYALRTDGLPSAVGYLVLWINRLNYHLTDTWDLGAEYRLLHQTLASDTRHGALLEVDYIVQRQVRVGVGYNFTPFSDEDYAPVDEDVGGPFFRVMAHY